VRPSVLALAGLTAGAALVGGLAVPAGASARIVNAQDDQGRPITFDVRANGVNVSQYTAILRDAIHGREIRTVTVRIVPKGRIGSTCGSDQAVACYSGNSQGGTIVVREGSRSEVEHSLLHEYGHHVDAAISTGSRQELNGTPRWWRARSMGTRLRQGQVAFDYELGWARSIGEIFAEDYVQVHVRGRYGIPWMNPPSEAVRRAIRQDVTGRAAGAPPRGGSQSGPEGPTDPPASSRSRTFRDRVELAPGEAVNIPFGLLGPGRRINFTAHVSSAVETGRVSSQLFCQGRRVTGGQGTVESPSRIKRTNLPPGSCRILATNLSDELVSVGTTLTLTRTR
jgi:hypothetical protein